MLIHLISATTWGGGERYALDICSHFREQGREVLAITRDSHAVDAPFEQAGIKVRHMSLRGYADALSPLRLARRLRRAQAPVVVHVHKYKDAFTALLARKLARRRDVRVILTRHLVKPGKDSWLAHRIFRNLDAQIFVSDLARNAFLSTWQGRPLPFPADRLHTIHNSLRIPPQPYQEPPQKGPRVVLFLGRLSPEKGIETLIEALPALRGRRARCWICGTGQADYVDSLKRLAYRRGVMDLIDWKGHVQDTAGTIAACHIAVLPSVARESFGLANIEMMARGRAQICTAHGAQSEYLVDGQSALFISPGDHQDLAEKIALLLDNPHQADRLARAAQADYTQNLSWPRFISRLLPLYSPNS